MTDQSRAIAAPFPAPPPFYQHFTKQNLAQLRRLQKDADAQPHTNGDSTPSQQQKPPLDLLSLPPELRSLLPPPPPAPDSTYRTFGSSISLSAPELSLADAGIEQLYPPAPTIDGIVNPQPHLIALARSLLTTYLSLIGTLSTNPEVFGGTVEDLQTLAFNMHDLINQYRPHQARESLVLMMEERVEGVREEVRRIKEGRGSVEELMAGLGGAEGDGGDVVKEEPGPMERREEARGDERERQRSKWRAMEREVGSLS